MQTNEQMSNDLLLIQHEVVAGKDKAVREAFDRVCTALGYELQKPTV